MNRVQSHAPLQGQGKELALQAGIARREFSLEHDSRANHIQARAFAACCLTVAVQVRCA